LTPAGSWVPRRAPASGRSPGRAAGGPVRPPGRMEHGASVLAVARADEGLREGDEPLPRGPAQHENRGLARGLQVGDRAQAAPLGVLRAKADDLVVVVRARGQRRELLLADAQLETPEAVGRVDRGDALELQDE